MKSTSNSLFQGMSGTLGSVVVTQQNGMTIVRERPRYAPNPTDDQQQARIAFQQATQTWRTLSPVQMQSWREIAPKIPRWDAPPGSVALNGQQAFVGHGMNRRVLGLPPLLLAPFVPTLPPFLPQWTARQVGTGRDFRLLLDSTGVDGWVQILTTPAMSRGRDVVGVKRYAQICVTDGIPAGTVDLTELFRFKYGPPAPFDHIGVRLCPLSAEGFRGPSVTQATVLPENGDGVVLELG